MAHNYRITKSGPRDSTKHHSYNALTQIKKIKSSVEKKRSFEMGWRKRQVPWNPMWKKK